jgi:hypothetical protein
LGRMDFAYRLRVGLARIRILPPEDNLMRRFLNSLILLAVFTAPAALEADTLYTADFSGGILYPSIGSSFDGLCSAIPPCGTVGGSFVFDADQTPAAGSGFVNVFFSGIPGSSSIPSATAFNISLGTNVFTLADTTTTTLWDFLMSPTSATWVRTTS